MVVAVWSVKGGVGVTSMVTMLSMGQAQRARDTLIVDLCGDVALLLGVEAEPENASPVGVSEWCALANPTADALERLEQVAGPDLRFIGRGQASLSGDPSALWSVLSQSSRQVVVDCGLVGDSASFAGQLVQAAPTSLLVVRECFLNLRAAQQSSLTPTGVVVLKEPGRCLGRSDVESVTGAPVVAECAVDPAVARALDAGVARVRLPRQLVRSLGKVLDRVG